MANNQSSICKGLSSGLWWSLALLGLGFLFFLMLSTRQDPIESDLKDRTMNGLAAENIEWATVDLDGRGRDLLLAGAAPSESARDQAIQLAENIPGVRVVDHNVEISAPLTSPHVEIQEQNGNVTLSGELATQSEIDRLLEAANSTYGSDKVVNNLSVSSQVKQAAWLSAAIGMLPGMSGIDSAHLKISDSDRLLTGETDSTEAKSTLLASANAMLGDLETEIVVTAPPVSEPEETEEPAEEALAEKPESASLAEAAVDSSSAPTIDHQKVCQTRLDDTMKDQKILFAYNSSELQESSHKLLDQIVAVLKECKDVVATNGLEISGHTDSRGDEAYNKSLSEKRAASVKSYLEKAGVDKTLMSSVGHGESQPVASNETEEGMSQNRRINFAIKHQEVESK